VVTHGVRGAAERAETSNEAATDRRPVLDPVLLTALGWRLIGPHRGGRVVAVAGDPADPLVFYFGATGGGVWKTDDGGISWRNVSDGFFRRASVGAIAVAESDPNVLYAGMGETTIRGNVSHGDGVYKSTDAGATWRHLGLAETRHIAKIRVHPTDPDLVYVAAFGHAHGPNPARGLYRSTDGGATWSQILLRSDRAGAIDLAMDRRNPRILYAAFWEAQRTPWSLTSGGPGSGLYKSTDGGDSWHELTRNPGLPEGVLGKIGLAVSPAQPDRVWALIEAVDGALFRSDDGGATWQRCSEERELRQRPWYYMHVYADPQQADTVWVLNLECWKSTDGGKTFATSVRTPRGDNHDLWIDPRNPGRMIESGDGGACVTFDGGASWSTFFNQPTAELYHVTTDNQVPYRVYGSQQDNTTISIPSLSADGVILQSEWTEPGGGESGHIAVRPDDPNIVYAGSFTGTMTRYDQRTRQYRDITPWPDNPAGWAAKDLKYRFQWTFPILLSPHDPDVLYAAGNRVFRTTDEGTSWEVVSPDLTRQDATKMASSGGPITQDNVSTEYYGTVFALAESPRRRGLLWAGSDDGLVHLSDDDGRTWRNVTPPDLPEWALVSTIEPSPHDPATAYLAATRYKLDDFRPYLWATDDYGAHWRSITDGLPADAFTRVVREDPHRRGLLYAGTETGLHVSFDGGGHWQPFQGNLPVAPVHDLVVKDTDLVVATHGRSFWVLDDVTPLHQVAAETAAEAVHLFAPRPTTRFRIYRGYGNRFPDRGKNYRLAGPRVITYYREQRPNGEVTETFSDVGTNPPNGVIVTYYLRERPEGDVALSFLDDAGTEMRSFTRKPIDQESPAASASGAGSTRREATDRGGTKERYVPVEPGTHRFVWDLRRPDARNVPGAVFWEGGVEGPVVPPGRYRVRLRVGGETREASFEIRKDPRIAASDEDLTQQYDLLERIREKLSQTHDAVNTIRALRAQLDAWEQRAVGSDQAKPIVEAARGLNAGLTAIERELIQVQALAYEDTLNYPIMLNNKLAALAHVVAQGDGAPTRQQQEVFDELAHQVDRHVGKLASLLGQEVSNFNGLVREAGIDAIGAPAPASGA
jgi:photosystem II stability/assembly factor-like uncharacterized protein